MKTIGVEELTALDLRVVLDGDRLVLTHHGKPKFAVISMHDLKLLEAQQMEDLQDEEDRFSLHDIKD